MTSGSSSGFSISINIFFEDDIDLRFDFKPDFFNSENICYSMLMSALNGDESQLNPFKGYEDDLLFPLSELIEEFRMNDIQGLLERYY